MENQLVFKNIDEFMEKIQEILDNNPRTTFYAQTYQKGDIASCEISFDGETLKQITSNNISLLISTCKNRKELKQYPFGDCKSHIEYRSIYHPSINESINNLLKSIDAPSISYKDDLSISFQTYVIKLATASNDYMLFISKKTNPIYNLKRKTRYWIFKDNSMVQIPEKLFQLTTTIDAIIYNGFIYFITLHLEKILGLETYAVSQKKNCISSFKKVLTESEYNMMYPMLKSTNANTFNSIIDSRIMLLIDLNKKKKIASQLHIPFANGILDLSSPAAKKSLLSFCENKIAINIEDTSENVYSPVPYQPIKNDN